MSNRNLCESKEASNNRESINSKYDHDRCRLPAIDNGVSEVYNMNSSIYKSAVSHSPLSQQNDRCLNQCSNLYHNYNNCGIKNALPTQVDCYALSKSIVGKRCTSAYKNCKINSLSHGTSFQRFPSSSLTSGCNQTNISNMDLKKPSIINSKNNYRQRLATPNSNSFHYSSSNMNRNTGQKTIIRDRHLANEILQKAGIQPNITSNDCLEVITDVPVAINDNVNCDPNPLCMKQPTNCQECYEQSIVVRHLQPPRPPAPPPIIIRERCAPPLPPPPPIVIRQIPARPLTPPPLIIRECPPPMPEMQEPTIIEREVPPPPPPPRQVIIERLPTPPPKPRSIIVEKWLPYEEPKDRPCIVEKVPISETAPTKNLIIQYEAIEPKIQSQCIDEGISSVDPKQFINNESNDNAEIFYVDQLNNLPHHIKCQLNPQALAAIGIQNDNTQNSSCKPCAVKTNPSCLYQQQPNFTRSSRGSILPQHSVMTNADYRGKSSCSQLCNSTMNHQQKPIPCTPSTPAVCLPQCFNKYNTAILPRTGSHGLTNLARSNYNPWATTYQVSYTNKARGMCRIR